MLYIHFTTKMLVSVHCSMVNQGVNLSKMSSIYKDIGTSLLVTVMCSLRV